MYYSTPSLPWAIPSHEGWDCRSRFDIIIPSMAFFSTLLLAVLTNAATLSDALQKGTHGMSFDIEAVVVSDCMPNDRDFAVMDGSGPVIVSKVRDQTNWLIRAGERIRARGTFNSSIGNHIYADCTSISNIGRAAPPPTLKATLKQVLSGKCDARVVSTSGMLRDYFMDELDDQWVYLIMNEGSETLYAVFHKKTSDEDLSRLDRLIGANITITGLCDPRPSGYRRRIGRVVRVQGIEAIKCNSAIPADPFSAPLVGSIYTIQPAELPKTGRRRTSGRVLAVWRKSHLIIQTAEKTYSRIDLAQDCPPKVGDTIEAVGFPETDLYHINLSRAIWRNISIPSVQAEEANDISARDITFNYAGHPGINAGLFGKAVRVKGMVRSLPSVGTNDGRLYMESDGIVIPVDISATPSSIHDISIGCQIRVSGICVMEVENWRPNLVFPHINEVFIAACHPGDLEVLSRPPWWTPGRLAIVTLSILMVLCGVLIWNRSLKALAERRGKALAHEELEHLASDLKASERTRLAVELHDSISQNLSGVSMELDTALNGEEPMPPSATGHLLRASKTLDSCRVELRNCIWDLRSHALDETDMNKAIRIALGPTIGAAKLFVRFNAPRTRFTDNTARTILNIVRELASNAIRHGHATEVRVAGSLDGETLKFSVQDNGCGFNPANRPGMPDGHFGLQGIEDRVATFEGHMDISSTAQSGTKVTIAFTAAINEDKEKI